jgi:adenine-specific DNA-methyltransferase
LIDRSKYRNPDRDPRGDYSLDPITQPKTRLERENGYYPIQDPRTGWWYPCNPDSVWRVASINKETKKTKLKSETIESLISDNRVWFSATEFVEYKSKRSLIDAIESKTGPVDGKGRQLLRANLPDIDFWIGKKIGLGRPSRKAFWKEKETFFKPVSSIVLGKHDDRDGEFTNIISEKQGEATSEIREIFGVQKLQFSEANIFD